uniref:WW domain-containing protein n=1 Tax=Trichobilharzia regenti TaxID=157069 RepID=A0AA85JUD2_TRIRE|nr:unnamed protein product [Trichobilharzia regenti]
MQRKLEPLPGLSNVTGKYTKKCTDEPYPRLFVHNMNEIKHENSGQLNKAKEETSGNHSADSVSPSCYYSTAQPALDDSVNPENLPVTHKVHYSNKPPYTNLSASKSTSAHSSIFQNAPNIPIGNKLKPQKSSIPVKPQEIPRTKRYMKEVVKSSSSGSVSALQSKPTGIIIATPCSPLVSEQGLTRSFDSFSVSGRAASSNSLSESDELFHSGCVVTPFAVRKEHSQRWAPSPSSMSSYPCGPENSSTSAKDQACNRTLSAQPSYLPKITKESSVMIDSQHFWKRFSDGQGDKQFYNSPSQKGSIDNVLNPTPVYISNEHSSNDSYPPADQRAWHAGYQEMRNNNQANRQIKTQLYGLQPRHASWGVGLSNTTGLRASGMPGPQCTQNALEHYLSDLIADEQRLMVGSPYNGSVPSYSEIPSNCGSNSSVSTSGETVRKTCSTDLLHFLEQRIENALRSMPSLDSKRYDYYGVQVRARPNRSASLNPVNEPCTNNVESSSLHSNFYQNQTMFDNDVQSSVYENIGTAQNAQYSGSYPSNMLQQFNVDELQYLLKAVKDLLALRIVSSTAANSSQGSDASKFGELDKQKRFAKTERPDTCTIPGKDDQSTHGRTGAESPYITRSVSSSRSNSAVRNNRFETSSESRSSRISSGASEDGSHSNADLMHQRLPIGFQHFERYLDSKFGPDHPTNGTGTNNSEMQTKPELVAKSKQSSAGHSSSVLSGNFSEHGSQVLTRQRTSSSIPQHLGANDMSSSNVNKVDDILDHFSVTNLSQYPVYVNEDPNQSYINSQSEQTDWNTAERSTAAGVPYVSASSQSDLMSSSRTANWHNNTCLTVPPISYAPSSAGCVDRNISHTNYYTDSNSSHVPDPQQGQATPWPPNWYQWYTSSHMFPQRYPSYSQFPYYHYFYPHLKQTQQQQTLQQQLCLDYTACAHRMNRLISPLSYAMNSPPNYSPAAHLCYMDASHAHVLEGHCASPLSDSCHFVSYDSQPPENPLPEASSTGGRCSCTNPDGLKRFVDRIPGNSYVFCRPSGVYSPPPAYPWFPYMNNVRWDPFSCYNNNNPDNHNWHVYFQRPGYNRFTSCMPRSGSANAGFTYTSETDNPPSHVSERGIPSEFDRLRQNNNRWDNYHYAGVSSNQISVMSDQVGDGQNFINNSNTNVLQSPAIRSMTNSFSANDLAAYHNQNRIGIRYTKSSFDLAPELPVEPGLALLDHSNFYSKISSLIEMDNNVRLILPNGWSERRSGLGRSYYTCDSTRRSTWNHPLIGPYIPLGWERVDSSQTGVYYQNLLIPHCQRHHPNLWISAPMKDPETERKSFFTDLRKLQLSLRHSLHAYHAEVGEYKNANEEQEQYYINRFRYLKLESLMEILYGLDQLFYQDLHALIVSFEQQRLSIVCHMFAIRPPQKTFPQFTDP